MEEPYKFRKVSDEFYYLLEKLFKKRKKLLTSTNIIGNAVKFLENFEENRL